jgi:RNA polymerase sigma-70 factor (ECF subfamily)
LEALTAAEATGSKGVAAVTEQGLIDEQDWVERAQQADTTAFESLYRLHVDRVYGLCLRMTGNPSEAEDCTQEAFIQAWNKLSKFRGDSAFSTWMHRIAVNSVLGRMRKARRELDKMQAVTDISPVPETVGDSGNFEDLQNAVDDLPDGARHVFVLHAVYGYSHDETGAMLGIAAGTSKAQLHRAKRLLASNLKINGYES